MSVLIAMGNSVSSNWFWVRDIYITETSSIEIGSKLNTLFQNIIYIHVILLQNGHHINLLHEHVIHYHEDTA